MLYLGELKRGERTIVGRTVDEIQYCKDDHITRPLISINFEKFQFILISFKEKGLLQVRRNVYEWITLFLYGAVLRSIKRFFSKKKC